MRGWLRVSLLSLLALLCLTAGAAAAETGGYIIRLEPRISLLGGEAALPEGVEEIYAPENLYRTEDEALIRELEAAGLLVYAEPDYPVELLDGPNDPAWTAGRQWDLEMVGMPAVWSWSVDGQAADGTRIRIGIVDSGVYAEHEAFRNTHFVPGVNFLAKEGTEERTQTPDTYGHGTFVAGIIAAGVNDGVGTAGIAPGAELMPIKCFEGQSGQLADVIAGIYAGVDGGCRILNLSLGLPEKWASQPLIDAIAYAAERDVIVVGAAGNSGGTDLMYPAAFDTVVGVGFVDSAGVVASKSHRNESVLVTAPGVSLYGPGISGPDRYTTGGGSSYATAEVSAAAALALSMDPELTPEEFMLLLSRSAEDRGDPGYDTSYGHGILRIDALLALLKNGCYGLDPGTGPVAVVRASGLTPGAILRAAQVIHDENGAQQAVLLTTLTAGEDGTLKERLALSGGRVTLMLLTEDWLPAMDCWRGEFPEEDPAPPEDPEVPPEDPEVPPEDPEVPPEEPEVPPEDPEVPPEDPEEPGEGGDSAPPEDTGAGAGPTPSEKTE